MFELAIVQNRTLARLLQAMALCGVLVPLTPALGQIPRLPIARQAKPAPPEVAVPAGKESIPQSVVVVSDSEKPSETPVPAAGALRPGAPQPGGLNSTPANNRYGSPTTQPGSVPPSSGTNPLPGFAGPKTSSVLAPRTPNSPSPSPLNGGLETLEPVTGEQETVPTPASPEEVPLSLETNRIGEVLRPLPPKRAADFSGSGTSRSILSSASSVPKAPTSPPAQPNAATPNGRAQVAAPRYAPVATDAEPMPTIATDSEPMPTIATDAEPMSAVAAEPAAAPSSATAASESLTPVDTETEAPTALPVADAPLADAPVPSPTVPTPVVATPVAPTKAVANEIAPATFREVEPGLTTLNQVIAAWGEPLEKTGEGGEVSLLYKIAPFTAVQVLTEGDVVANILIRIDGTLAPEPLAERLQLGFIRAVEVRDEQGRPLGRAFPERGVLFGYDPASAEPAVAQVLLETIDTQAFYLRAETNWRSQAATSLEDLKYVVAQTPNDAAAQHLMARLYLSLGQVDVALEAVDKARQLDPEEYEYRLTRVQCLSQLGKEKEAAEEATAVRLTDGISSATKGRALLLLGDLLASGSQRDFKAAIAMHMEAIKLVEPLAADPLVATRRKAKEVLLAATLAVARDVAWGNWNRKDEVVPKWIEKADAYARDAIENDGAGFELRVMVIEQALAAHTGFKPAVDPAQFLAVAEELTKNLTESTNDPLARQAAEWELGRVYNHAVRLAHLRATVDEGFKYGTIAQEKLENAAAGRGSSVQARDELGRLYFHLGVLHAVHQQNHEQAVEWYDRAQELLLSEEHPSALDSGQFGEMLVSMGVSYWQVDLKQKGLELTTLGTGLVKEAVEHGTVAADSLIVPYGNLASMHAELGQPEKAREINLTAEKLQQTQLK